MGVRSEGRPEAGVCLNQGRNKQYWTLRRNYNKGLGDPNNPVDIRPRNRKEHLGTRGLTIYRCLSFFIIFFSFFHLALPSLKTPTSPPSRLSPLSQFFLVSNFHPLLHGKQERIWGVPEVINFTTYLYLSRKGGRSKSYNARIRKSPSPYTYTFIYLLFFLSGG